MAGAYHRPLQFPVADNKRPLPQGCSLCYKPCFEAEQVSEIKTTLNCSEMTGNLNGLQVIFFIPQLSEMANLTIGSKSKPYARLTIW